MQNQTHSNHLENRLTRVEIHQDEHKEILHDHTLDIKDIRSQMITPRDVRMMIAGILTIAGALAGKVEWRDALSLFLK